MSDAPPAAPLAPDAELERLRELLLVEDRSAFNHLASRFADKETYAREVSEVVTEALYLRSAEDDRLNTVLQPTVEHIVKGAFKRNPAEFAEEMFPVIGPAIRRSIAETFRSMLQGFSKSMEMSFSWRGLLWRLEALRSGRPFSEVVMLHSLVYRVEQIFFIHSETGLLLDHLVNEGVETQDADLVSGMLTAIQDFARDCFSGGANINVNAEAETGPEKTGGPDNTGGPDKTGDPDKVLDKAPGKAPDKVPGPDKVSGNIDSMHLDDRTILLARSRKAYLACVINGNPPVALQEQLRDALDLAILDCLELFENFSGEVAPFQRARPHFLPLLITRVAEKSKYHLLSLVPAAFIITLVLGVGYMVYYQWDWNSYIEKLDAQPGIIVTEVERNLFNPWKVSCMQDALSEDPKAFLVKQGFPEKDLALRAISYLSLDDDMVALRVQSSIKNLPAGVQMRFDSDSGTVYFTGEAPLEWTAAAREKALSIPGVNDVVTSGLKDPRTDRLRDLIKAVEGARVYYDVNQSVPTQDSQRRLETAVDKLVELDKLAREMGISVSLIIYGHADSTGSVKYNYELSQERGRYLAGLLYTRGAAIPVNTYGMGSDQAAENNVDAADAQSSRRIDLKVNLSRVGSAMQDIFGDAGR